MFDFLGVIGKIGNLDSEGEEAMDTSINVQESDVSGSEFHWFLFKYC